jgi:hypothetical protein
VFRAEADIALITGLEGIVAYLLCQFYEETVEKILRQPQVNAGMPPEEVAKRTWLMLRADATFGYPACGGRVKSLAGRGGSTLS